ncbi:MAG: hypothetical protein LBP20_10110 [Treponema sp.]|nr:hypothetical protein [Treponema sp.]
MTARWEYLVGIGCLGLYFILNRFTKTPNLIQGFIFGIGLVCLIIGILPENAFVKIKGIKNIILKE